MEVAGDQKGSNFQRVLCQKEWYQVERGESHPIAPVFYSRLEDKDLPLFTRFPFFEKCL